jgi:hypothetical protein
MHKNLGLALGQFAEAVDSDLHITMDTDDNIVVTLLNTTNDDQTSVQILNQFAQRSKYEKH